MLGSMSDRIVRAFAERPGEDPPLLAERATPWFEQAVVPAIRAVLGLAPHRGFANLANDGLVIGLPKHAVVEVPIERSAIVPPREVLGFLQRVAESELLAFDAARARDPKLLRRSMEALPLPLTARMIDRLTERALEEIA